MITTLETPPTAAEVLADGTESDLDREVAVTNPGHDGYIWFYAVQNIDYIGLSSTGGNQLGAFPASDDLVINGFTYHVWGSEGAISAAAFDYTWYAYESALYEIPPVVSADPQYTLITMLDTPPPTTTVILADGTESNLEREVAVTNPGHDGYLWIYSTLDINYIGLSPSGGNQISGFPMGVDVVLNGTTYHVWRSLEDLVAGAFDLTWYAFEG